MPTLKLKIKGQDVEAYLTLQEFLQLLNENRVEVATPNQKTLLEQKPEPQEPKTQVAIKPSNPEKPYFQPKTTEKQVDEPLQPDIKIKQYILSKQPNFTHDLFELQRRFYGREYTSRRETSRMYHKIFRQTQRVREEIEREEGGRFVIQVGENRVNQYIFQKDPDKPKIAGALEILASENT